MDNRWYHAIYSFGGAKMLNAVGVDVSKGKSTISVLQPGGVIVRKPFDVTHSKDDLKELARYVKSLDGETKVVMECTGRYHEPLLRSFLASDIFVCAVNPHLIKNYGNNSLRKVKSDPADSRKIARYALDNWAELRQYSTMDTTREQLKTLNAQMDFFTKQKAAQKTNLISILDMTYPGLNSLFSSPARSDGSEKWIDYAASFWHVDCVRSLSLKTFTERYQAFCVRHSYNFRPVCIRQLKTTIATVEQLRQEMNDLAKQLPEYDTVMSMAGVGKTLGPQLIAEIGDISRFTHREALTAYAGVDPGVDESGQRKYKSNGTSKVGPPRLRKALFLVISSLLQTQPEDDKVYQFVNKKRAEGKPYHVYMTAGANKFLRIYYGKVKECLALQSETI